MRTTDSIPGAPLASAVAVPSFIASVAVLLLVGCASTAAAPDAGPPRVDLGPALDEGPEPDLGSPDAGPPACSAVSINGTWSLDNTLPDAEAWFAVPIAPDVDGEPLNLLLGFFRTHEPFTGEFALGEGLNASIGACNTCALLSRARTLDGLSFFATDGTLILSRDPFTLRLELELRDVVFREIDEGLRPIDDGACATLDERDVDAAAPLAEWTCDAERWRDGETCDCECGVYDPDCYAEGDLPVAGCIGDAACRIEYPGLFQPPQSFCVASCAGGQACGSGTCVPWYDGLEVCLENDADRMDTAAFGEPCSDHDGFALKFCGVEAGRATGFCGRDVCQPFCVDDVECAGTEVCEGVLHPLVDGPLPADGEYVGRCVPNG